MKLSLSQKEILKGVLTQEIKRCERRKNKLLGAEFYGIFSRIWDLKDMLAKLK